jgi:hypothetical protein
MGRGLDHSTVRNAELQVTGYNHVRLRVNGTRRKRKGRDSAHLESIQIFRCCGTQILFCRCFSEDGKTFSAQKNPNQSKHWSLSLERMEKACSVGRLWVEARKNLKAEAFSSSTSTREWEWEWEWELAVPDRSASTMSCQPSPTCSKAL